MEMFPLYELMQGQDCGVVYNRGVGGYTMADFIKHMPTLLFDLAPETIFLNIGSNDMSEADYTVEKLLHNYRVILSSIGEHLPAAQTYLMAFYPMNEHCGSRSTYGARNNARIAEANKALKRLSEKYDRVCFIDVNAGLSDETGALKAEWCIDGIHMYPEAYAVVFANLLPWLRGRA